MTQEEKKYRQIRSFVRREGRMTKAQTRAIELYWQHYGIDVTSSPISLNTVFSNNVSCTVEIGFGMGDALLSIAEQKPEQNFIGIEVYRPGVGTLLNQLAQRNLKNVRVICADAVEVFNTMIVDESLAGVHIFFPDPWHKKRHHKRRLIQEPFIALLISKLMPTGYIHLATDWQPYAEEMLSLLESEAALENTSGKGQYAKQPDYRVMTKFEKRGELLGHGVWDLIFVKKL